jgi:hypothetical protein
MAFNPVSPEDFAALSNLMGRYQYLVDAGDEEGWVELFTEDGAFQGLGPEADEQFRGREGLKGVVRMNVGNGGGRMRHNMTSFSAEYGDSTDEAHARYYMVGIVTPPGQPAQIAVQVDVHTHFVCVDGEWKIKTNRMTQLS